MSESDMRITDLVSAIAKVLSSQVMLEQFQQQAASVAQQFQLTPQDRARFVALDPRQLRQQAESLVLKRWHEVQRLAPLTVKLLGNDAEEIFRYYASNHWPEGHQRHPKDAYRFLEFLAANEVLTPPRSEQLRLRKLAT